VMSALPSKADICSAAAYVRFGPIADMPIYMSDGRRLHLFVAPARAMNNREAAPSTETTVLRTSWQRAALKSAYQVVLNYERRLSPDQRV
jgi:hypothetical protein